MDELVDELLSQVAIPSRAVTLKRQAELFNKLSVRDQEKKLPSLYLQLRRFLIVESGGNLLSETIDDRIRGRYAPLVRQPSFGLLFEKPARQETLLGIQLLEAILRRAIRLLGGGSERVYQQALQWLSGQPSVVSGPIPFLQSTHAPLDDSEWPEFLKELFLKFCESIQHPLGEEATSRLVQSAYEELAQAYAELDSFVSVLGMIPDRLLDNEKLRLLSRNQIEKVLLSKVEHLERTNSALIEAQAVSARSATQLRDANLQLAASNEELQKTLRVQEEFTSMVSHELRTPLTAIVGAASVLQQHAAEITGDKCQGFLKMIVSESWRLTRLVSEILDLSRIQKKGIALNYETLKIPAIVAEIVNEMRVAHPKKVFEMRFCPSAQTIDGDRDRLRQILVNLIGNATKYTPDGAMIVVETKSEKKSTLFKVADSGPGIPPDQHERIFDPFYRTKDAINYKTPGTGLGLTITKAIVDAMGGRIWVANQEPHGCVMTVSLPTQFPISKAA